MGDQAIDYGALAEQARQGTPPPAGGTGNINYNLMASQARGEQLEPIEYREGMPVYSIDVYGRAGAPPQPPVYQGTDAQGKPIIASPPGPPAAPLPYELQGKPAPTLENIDPRTGEFIQTPRIGTVPLLDSPFTGGVRAIGGYERVRDAKTARDVAGGSSEMVRGGLEALTPLIPGALAGAPLSTALTLLSATGLSSGTESALNYVGVPKEYSALVSDLVGLYGAHRTLKWMGGIANLPYMREADAINQRLNQAMEQAKDPNASPADRAAARAQVEGLMDGLKQAEAGSPGGYFLPQVSLGTRPGTPWVKNQLNPVEQASQDYLRQQGINTPLSMQTGDPRAAHLEGLVRQSPGGGYANESRNLTRQQVEALGPQEFAKLGPDVTPEEAGTAVRGRLAGDLEQQRKGLVEQVSPTASTPEVAGAAVREQIAGNLERERRSVVDRVSPTATTPELAGARVLEKGKQTIRQFDQAADKAYQAAWLAERDPRNIEEIDSVNPDGSPAVERMALPIDMADLREALKPLADRYAYTLSETDARASLGLKTMRQIINGPRFKPASAAEMDLGMLKEAARNENLPELRDQSQGLAAASVAQLQQAIDAKMARAAYPGWDGSGTSPALEYLQSGRMNTAKKHGVADIFKPFGRNIEQVEPVAAFNRMTWSGDAGIEHLRNVARIAPEQMPEVGRAFIDSGGKWGMLGPETKKILFRDPELIKNLDAYYARKEQFGSLTEKEPVALFKSLTARGDAGIEQLREIAKEAPEQMPAVGRAFIDSGGKWDSLGPETKRVLFKDPELIKNLDEYFAKHEKFGGLTEMNPVDLFNKLTAPEGKPNELLADLKAEAPEQMPGLLRAFVGELWNRVTREGDFKKVQSALNTWLQMDPKTKALLSEDPGTVSNLNNLFFALNRLVHEVNPSGSGYIIALNAMKSKILSGAGMVGGGAMGMGHGGAAGAGVGVGLGLMAGAGLEVLANKGIARLLFDPRFTKLLTQGIRFQLQGNDEGARLIGESLSRMAEPPETPPAGQPPAETPPAGQAPAGQPPAGQAPAAPGLGEKVKGAVKEFWQSEEGTSKVPEKWTGKMSEIKGMVQWAASRIGEGVLDPAALRKEIVDRFGKVPGTLVRQIAGQARDLAVKNAPDWRLGTPLDDIHPLTSEKIPLGPEVEPSLSKKKVRLYSGHEQGSDSRIWTPDRGTAEGPLVDAKAPSQLSYIDVKPEDAQGYESGDKAGEKGRKLMVYKPGDDPARATGLLTEDVQRYLQDMVRKRLGEVPDDAPDNVKMRRLLRYGRGEFAEQLRQPYSGVDWYGPDTTEGDRLLRQVRPELADSDFDTIQKAMSAAMSNNSNPQAEAFNGARIWEQAFDTWKRNPGSTLQFPELQPDGKSAWPAQGAGYQIAKLNQMIQELGVHGTAEFLRDPRVTGRMIKHFVPNAKEIRLDERFPGSQVLGPKIGVYFSQIMDIPQSGSVVDVWMMRRLGRILGTLFDQNGKQIDAPRTEGERVLSMDLDGRLAKENSLATRDAQSVGWHYEQELYRRLGLKVKSYRRSDGIQKYLDSLEIK